MGRSGERASKLGALLLALAAAGGCGRSGFEDLSSYGPGPGEPADGATIATSRLVDGGAAALTTAADAAAPSSSPVTPHPPPATRPPRCTPHPETCNGKDDDCDGEIDQGLPPIPCAGGGEQYCVAGRYSACPQRCETCIPGSERVCFLSYCTYWATQVCSADGASFGTCRERHVPPECGAVSSADKESPALEQCCIDHGYCCRDDYDLDHDGNRDEMLGSCDEVSCHP